jgi:hypothetical protein
VLPEDMAEMALVEEAEFLGEVNDRLRGCDETLTGISQSQLSDVSGEGEDRGCAESAMGKGARESRTETERSQHAEKEDDVSRRSKEDCRSPTSEMGEGEGRPEEVRLKRNHPLRMVLSAGRRTNVGRRRGLPARTVSDFHAHKMYCFCTADLRLDMFSPLLTKDQRHLQNPHQRWFSLYF